MPDNHLVGDLGKRHRGEREIQPLEAKRRQSNSQTKRGTNKHHVDNAQCIAVLTTEVRKENGADASNCEVGETHLPGPTDQRDERDHDQTNHHESGTTTKPHR